MTKREFIKGICKQCLEDECTFKYFAMLIKFVDEYAAECDMDEDFDDFLADTLKLL